MEAQNIIDTLVHNKTTCTVCFKSDFKVEVLTKHLLISLMKIKEKPTGISLIVAECKNCKNILLFNSTNVLNQ